MNNAGLPNDETRDVSAFIERQQRILKAVKEELHASHEKLKQTLRQHDDIFYRLFPPVRPGRDPALIESSIEETRKQLARLRQAIFNQRLELESLLQSSSTFTSPADADSVPRQPPSGIQNHEEDERENWANLVNEGRDNLAKLKKEFAGTRQTLEKLEALLSPIRMLPMEVLGEIFTHCLETTTYEPMSLNSGPLLMTHICSSWRTIAINKPDLWTNIWVSIENDDDKEGWPALVKVWVERSKQLPLSFHIQESETHNYLKQPHSVFFRILDILSAQSHRWKSVELLNRNFQAVGETEWFQKLPQQPGFPLLESITLHTRKMDIKETTLLTKMLRSSPRLNAVTWTVKMSLSMPALPWGQLTHLSLVFISSLEEIQNVVSNSPLLHTLDVSIQILPGAQGLRRVTHQNIQTVYISSAGDLKPLFDSFTLPNVRDLTVDQMPEAHPVDANGPWPHAAFMAFLQRSKCALRRFVLLDVSVTQDAELVTLLRHLSPSLRKLGIENFNYSFVTDNMLRALTYPDQTLATASTPEAIDLLAAALCPHLEELKLSGCMNSTDGVLADMVESRWKWPKNHPSLRRLKRGEFSANSPPARPLDQERITGLRSLKLKYTLYETY